MAEHLTPREKHRKGRGHGSQKTFNDGLTEMGFTILGIEADWPESLVINDYVVNGKSDPISAPDGLQC